MAGPLREQALPLLAAANNHGDLSVKLASLKQARDVLLSADPSIAAEFLPYLVELQSSPESLVRKALVELIEDVGLKASESLSILFPVVLTFLQDNDTIVVRQSIISGTNIFSVVLEVLSSQFHRHGIVERWLEELWSWMVKFKDAVFGILFEAGPVGTKLLALKFLEIYILTFTSDNNDSENFTAEASIRNGRAFNVSWVISGHPVLDPHALMSEANRYFRILLDMLQSSSSFPGSLTISVVNCLPSGSFCGVR